MSQTMHDAIHSPLPTMVSQSSPWMPIVMKVQPEAMNPNNPTI